MGELQKIHALINDIWLFEKKYYAAHGDDAYWQALVDEVGALEKKHDFQLAKDLLLACVSDIERRARRANETAKEST